MPDLPSLRPREVVRALEKAGFRRVRQKGSHAIVRHQDTQRWTTVAIHPHEMPRYELQTILKQVGLSVEEFIALL